MLTFCAFCRCVGKQGDYIGKLWRFTCTFNVLRELPCEKIGYLALTTDILFSMPKVVNELYDRNNVTFSDGAYLATHFRNRTFALRTGRIVLNEIGERIMQINVRQVQNSLDFEVLCEARTLSQQASHLRDPKFEPVYF